MEMSQRGGHASMDDDPDVLGRLPVAKIGAELINDSRLEPIERGNGK